MGKFCVMLTDDQILAAYERRRRPTWPEGFDAAMADPVCGRLVVLEAWCHERRKAAAQRYAERRQTRVRPAMQRTERPALPPAQLSLLPAPALDHKRRAAGERLDD